ncbi:MAG: DPP IV N-terminal domain-containing protein [Bacteroidales bacterium]
MCRNRLMNFSRVLTLLGFLVPAGLFSQPDTSDYGRAGRLQQMVEKKVFYGSVRPNWINNTGRFVYESNTPVGIEYYIVDALSKTRQVAFDQKRFAEAFEKATGQKAIPGRLPIRNIVFSERLGSFSFNYDNYNWICILRNYRIIRGDRTAERTKPESDWSWGFRDELQNTPVQSPDKKWTAFIKNYNVYIKSAEDNKEYQLSYDGGTGEYYSSYIIWSPDSKKLVAKRVRPAEKHMIHYVESSPEEQLQPRHFSYEYQKPGDAVPQFYPQLFDAENKKHIKIDDSLIPNQYYIDDIKWSKDSKYFTFEYNKRGHQVYQVIRVDAETGETTIIINETSSTFFHYSAKKYRYDLEKSNEVIWASERDGWNHLYLYDGLTGKVKNQITKGEWVIRRVIWIDEEAREIIFQASGKEPGDPYFIDVYRINFDGTELKRLTDGYGNHEVSFSPDKRFFVDTWSTVDTPPVVVLRSAEDGSMIMELEKADISLLLATGIRLPEPFVAKGRDGVTDIYGIIIRPMTFNRSKKYPVIENIYAGPHSNFGPKSFRPLLSGMHQLAELGFIVVQIDGMGTSNRSKAFHDVAWKNLRDAGLPDRILWIKAAARKYPYMDTMRVGIYGTSAGGQNAAAAILFHPEFYKVAVASCGCHDNRMDKMWWNEQFMGWPVGPEYAESSNVENAWRLKGKLMLINAEMDKNVDPSSTVQFVNALIKENKEFEYVFIPGAGHSGGGPYGERKRYDFFVKHLLGVDPPDWNNKLN